jgi:predicted RND superfamily exporter protein
LTSLTTFLGLAPMIFETSVQARFLVPMAISLGFGVLFATFSSLVTIPAIYLILEELKHLFGFGPSIFSQHSDEDEGIADEDARDDPPPGPAPEPPLEAALPG